MNQDNVQVGKVYLTKVSGQMVRVVVMERHTAAPGTDPTNTYWFLVRRENQNFRLPSGRTSKELFEI